MIPSSPNCEKTWNSASREARDSGVAQHPALEPADLGAHGVESRCSKPVARATSARATRACAGSRPAAPHRLELVEEVEHARGRSRPPCSRRRARGRPRVSRSRSAGSSKRRDRVGDRPRIGRRHEERGVAELLARAGHVGARPGSRARTPRAAAGSRGRRGSGRRARGRAGRGATSSSVVDEAEEVHRGRARRSSRASSRTWSSWPLSEPTRTSVVLGQQRERSKQRARGSCAPRTAPDRAGRARDRRAAGSSADRRCGRRALERELGRRDAAGRARAPGSTRK